MEDRQVEGTAAPMMRQQAEEHHRQPPHLAM